MNSRDYWIKREQAYSKTLKTKVESETSKIIAEYKNSLQDIINDINSNYIRYADGNAMTMREAMKLADRFDIDRVKSKIKYYVNSKKLTKEQAKELKLYNLKIRVSRLQLMKIEIEVELKHLQNLYSDMVNNHLTDNVINEYRRQASILGKSVNFTDELVKSIVNGSYQYANSQNGTFSDYIWGDVEALKSKINEILNKVLIQGKNPNQFNKLLADLFNKQRYQVSRLLITETARVQGNVQLDSFDRSGYEYYEIIYESKACEICRVIASGGKYEISKAEVGVNIYPFHPNCLCSVVGVE